ncbi:MAG: hypothetical protein MJE68_26845, partial [Proteobacteria bacterium]|nr:hypothetical protein [Pseudomonadota bacterium]
MQKPTEYSSSMSVDLATNLRSASQGAKSKRRFRPARNIISGVRDINVEELPNLEKIPVVNAVIQKRNIKADYYDQER